MRALRLVVLVGFARTLVIGALLLLLSAPVSAVVVWNETSDGDLSGDRLAPTSIALSAGTNSIAGSMAATDKEYFTVVVPPNHEFTELITSQYEGDDFVAFIALQEGTQMTVPPNTSSADGLLGWAHIGEFSVDQDLLPTLGQSGFGATGFTPPLPSGSYTFWLQQLDGFLVTYEFDFEVTPTSVLTGDYNGNGVVDAADYVLWRDGGTLQNDPTPGVQPEDYDVWRANFGMALSVDEGQLSALVPEPASLPWLLLAALIGLAGRRNRHPANRLPTNDSRSLLSPLGSPGFPARALDFFGVSRASKFRASALLRGLTPSADGV